MASALLVDYVLTVAVSISSGAQYAAAAIDPLQGHEATIAIIAVLFLMTMNLRGVKESGTAFAIPTYIFMVVDPRHVAAGASSGYFFGNLPKSERADYTIQGTSTRPDRARAGVPDPAGVRVRVAALTGVEAISNGVPAFRKPKSKNAATTLALLGTIAITMGLSILILGNLMDVRLADVDNGVRLIDPAGNVVAGRLQPGPGDRSARQGRSSTTSTLGFYIVAAATGVILVLAANTAYNGFPVLGSILARDGYLPRQLHSRGDRLAFSNGIVLLAGFAHPADLSRSTRRSPG